MAIGGPPAAACCLVHGVVLVTGRNRGYRGPSAAGGPVGHLVPPRGWTGVTAGSWQPASRPAAAGASVGGGSAGPSLEGYGRGLRAGSVQVCWTGCDAGRGGY